jgi:GNAT superfamily N-acetyltransferase
VTADIATRIRAAGIDDSALLLPLLHELGYPGTLQSASARWRSTRAATPRACWWSMVKEAGTLAGLIAGHLIPLLHQPGNLGRITALIVARDAQERGVGTALLAAIERWFAAQNCLRYEVTSGDQRAAAHRFHACRGYVSDERRSIKRSPAS